MASRTAYSTWTPQKPTIFDGHYLRNRSTFDIDVLGCICIVQHKEHPPEVWSVPPVAPCIFIIHVPLISAALPRPVGRRRIFVAVSPSLVKMAIRLPSVPRFMYTLYRDVPFIWLIVISCRIAMSISCAESIPGPSD